VESNSPAPNANTAQDLFRVILLEPKESLNIGSVARAMMNLGFRDLVLASPLNFELERAATTARRARSLFEPPKIAANLKEGIYPCTYVVGFSTKDSKNTPPVLTLDQWAQTVPTLCKSINAKIGLLFGPEDTGLRYEHLPVCNAVVRIPSSDEYDSLNLAQAVLLALYSINLLSIPSAKKGKEASATAEQFSAMDELIIEISGKSKFSNEGTPENTLGLLKNLFRRPELTQREMQILLGFFSRIGKSID